MPELIEAVVAPLHVIFGFTGLAVFWIPIVVRKGGHWHVTLGRIFVNCAYVVLFTAGITVIYRLVSMLLAGEGPTVRPAAFSFVIFLGYLTLVTFITVRHSIGVLLTKRDPASLRTGFNIFMSKLAIASSVGLIIYTVIFRPPTWILLIALSPIGLGVGYGIHKYLSGELKSQKQWLYEHLGGMIGAGIAFHTAFAVFGFGQLFEFRIEGLLAIVPWVLPAIIGIPATVLWTRHYQKKFGELQV